MSIEQAYEYCQEIIETHSKTFATAFSILPTQKRKAVWAVYAFCRTVDDIVDEENGTRQDLDQFENECQRFFKGELLEHPIWIALDDVRRHFLLDEQPFLDMIKGQKMDYMKHRYETLAELEHYSYHVASTVGLMLLPILAPHEEEKLKEGAVALGLAMQLTNILRDVGEDLQKGRVYLPKEILDEHHYSYIDLMKQNINLDFIAVWESVALRAEKWYEKASSTISHYPPDARIPVYASLTFYREILMAVRRNGYNVFEKRAVLTKTERDRLLFQLHESLHVVV